MRVSRALFHAGLGLLALAALAILVGGAQGAASNASRVDAGPPLEVRLNEAFFLQPTEIYQDVDNGIEIRDQWWDLNNRTDNPVDGNPTNDRDDSRLSFLHTGLSTLGSVTFTLWINFTDGRVESGSRQIQVVENRPPDINFAGNPSGFVGEAIPFTVTVTDPDSPETTLQYSWDFDVTLDSFTDGIPDNDIDSQLKSGVTHVYPSEQTYTAKLTVRDDFNATKEAFVQVTVQRPPGITEREVAVGDFFTDNVTIRRDGWVSYHMKVRAGRLYQYDIDVKNDAPVYVMVQFGQQQFDQYKFRTSQTAYVAEWSHVNTRENRISFQFRPTQDGDLWITVDNGYLFQVGSGKAAETVITVQDADRNNLLANIPLVVWIAIAAVGVGVLAFFGIRGYIAGAEVRRAEHEKAQQDSQEKAAAKNELDMFLSDPDAAAARARAPAPPPMFVPTASPAGPAAPPPRPGPRPAGPAPPPGYTPRPAGPPPAPRAGPGGPQPPPGYPPRPAPSAGPRPAPAPQAAPAAPAACGSCGMAIEAGWKLCPNCGSALQA